MPDMGEPRQGERGEVVLLVESPEGVIEAIDVDLERLHAWAASRGAEGQVIVLDDDGDPC